MLSKLSSRRAMTIAIVFAASAGQLIAPAAQAACSSPKNDQFRNPFNKSSAHHRPIGSGAQYASATHPATRDWLKANKFNVNTGVPFGTDVLETDGGDAIRTIGAKATCDRVIGLPVSIRFPQQHVTSIENNTAGCPDGDVVLFDRTNGKPHHLRQYNWNQGRPTAGQYRTFDARGLGHGTGPQQRLGMAASGVAGLFGVLRGHEINTPGYKVEHALRMGLPRKPGCKIMLSREIVLPATGRDGSATSAGHNTGHIPYGGLLALPPSVNIGGMGLSEPGKRLAEAIQNYGIYVGDGGGCGAGALEADQTVNGTVKRQLLNDIPKIYSQIRLVLNNNVLGSSVAGGGAPLAPNCAFDAS